MYAKNYFLSITVFKYMKCIGCTVYSIITALVIVLCQTKNHYLAYKKCKRDDSGIIREKNV